MRAAPAAESRTLDGPFPSQLQGDVVYEEFFGLSQRPFPAVPAADEFISLPGIQDCLDSLLQCVIRSRGIAVVTAGSGMGKSLLCRKVAALLRGQRTIVAVSASTFQSRLELLQALLYELDLEYLGLSEQEARLKLTEAARRVAQCERPLLVILDEAHSLPVRLFDELRSFVDAAPDGVPLMGLVLCGQFELEEKLADPALAAFNQRIGVQVCLPPLTREESARFLTERLRLCGAHDIQEILTPDALSAICRASDGNLRCLSQLADHSLLLAFGISRKPFDARLVRDALQDLKELPLHWNDLAELVEEQALPQGSRVNETISLPEDWDGVDASQEGFVLAEGVHAASLVPILPLPVEPPMASIEVGAGLEETGVFETPDWDHLAILPAAEPALDTPTAPVAAVAETSWLLPPELPADNLDEVNVVDRYALLDRVRELPPEKQASVDFSCLDRVAAGEKLHGVRQSGEEPRAVDPEEDLLQTVRQIRQEILIAVGETRREVEEVRDSGVSRTTLCDIVLPPGAATTNPQASQHAVRERADAGRDASGPRTRYHDLFTRLSRRRRDCGDRPPS